MALVDADRPVVLLANHDDAYAREDLQILLDKFKIVRCYPDTTDAWGKFNSTFKIEVRR